MAIRLPAYLLLSRHNVFYFRIAVPKALRPLIGRQETRISLLTSDRRDAIIQARKWKMHFDDWFETIASMKLPEPKLVRITGDTALYTVWVEEPSPSGRYCRQHYVRIPANKDLSAFTVKLNADGTLSVEEIPDDVTEEDAERIAKAAKVIAGHIRDHVALPAPAPIQESPQPTTPALVAPKPDDDADHRMSFALKKYLKEKTVDGKRVNARWNAKTAQQNMSRLRLVQAYLGDPILRTLAPLQITRMKDDLHYLPKGFPSEGISQRRLHAAIRLQKWKEKKEHPLDDVIDIVTLNQILSRLSGFMEWCVNQGYIASNVAYKKTIRLSHADDDDDDSRIPWEEHELRSLFESRFYSEHMYVHPYQYWLPVIAIHSGARVNELAQLHTDDIVEDPASGIWCIKIFPDRKLGQKVKNKRAKRLVPLHRKVIELGFLDFVKSRVLQGKGQPVQLFIGLTLQRDGYGKNASRWFNETYKSYLGYGPHDGKVFHSFRRNVIDELKQFLLISEFGKQIDDKDILTKAIVGHKGKHDITWDHYAGKFRPPVLKPVVDQLKWPISFIPYVAPDPTAARQRLKAWMKSIRAS